MILDTYLRGVGQVPMQCRRSDVVVPWRSPLEKGLALRYKYAELDRGIQIMLEGDTRKRRRLCNDT